MIEAFIPILIGIVFTFLKMGGRGRVRGHGFDVTAGAGIILIIVGVLLLRV